MEDGSEKDQKDLKIYLFFLLHCTVWKIAENELGAAGTPMFIDILTEHTCPKVSTDSCQTQAAAPRRYLSWVLTGSFPQYSIISIP